MKISKKNRRVVLICILSAFCISFFGILIYFSKCLKDFSTLKNEEYDTIFMSMYSIEDYDEADYEYYRIMDLVKTTHVISDTRIMKLYMDVAAQSDNVIHTVYLGIDPEKVRTEDIFQIVLENPDILFEVVLAYPEMKYWLEKEEEEYQKALNAYREFAGNVLGLENVRVYYFCNAEWLLCNQANYIDAYRTNEETSELIMCNTDDLHPFMLTVENFHDRFYQAENLVKKYRTEVPQYVDASDWDIVFFGDSVIGNYEGSFSIPGVVNGLTNAAVYNCGYGGRSAAVSENTQEPLPLIVEAFIEKDLSKIPEDTQVYKGLEHYIHTAASEGAEERQLMFVINYGLNDYFRGVPVEASDLYDVTSYMGAFRLALEKLQDEYPQAKIILMTPNLSINYDFGQGIQSENGGKLEDYADALLQLGEEYGVEVLDNFREFPVEKKQYWILLADGTHPNEQGRFMIGDRIARKMEEMITD